MRTYSQSRSRLSQRGGSVTATSGRTPSGPSRLASECEAASVAGLPSLRCIWLCFGWAEISLKTSTEHTWWCQAWCYQTKVKYNFKTFNFSVLFWGFFLPADPAVWNQTRPDGGGAEMHQPHSSGTRQTTEPSLCGQRWRKHCLICFSRLVWK